MSDADHRSTQPVEPVQPLQPLAPAQVAGFAERVLDEVARAVVGKREVLSLVLAGILAKGHVLLEDFPGLGKTLAARSFAGALGLEFSRAQFTPDLLPADLTGSYVYDQRRAEFDFRPGPVFAGLLLADEVNRTPPKTQAALLEAMQERQVTVGGETHPLPDPFLVVATQNPIEYEGTYPLPEAQLDRFLFKVDVGYPGEEDERAMLRLPHRGVAPAGLDGIEAVARADELLSARDEVDAITIADEVAAYVTALVRKTRELPSVALGASPRAAVHLAAASRAAAWLAGRAFATPDDVARMALPVLRHRLILRPEAELERYRADDAVQAALQAVPVPR